MRSAGRGSPRRRDAGLCGPPPRCSSELSPVLKARPLRTGRPCTPTPPQRGCPERGAWQPQFPSIWLPLLRESGPFARGEPIILEPRQPEPWKSSLLLVLRFSLGRSETETDAKTEKRDRDGKEGRGSGAPRPPQRRPRARGRRWHKSLHNLRRRPL